MTPEFTTIETDFQKAISFEFSSPERHGEFIGCLIRQYSADQKFADYFSRLPDRLCGVFGLAGCLQETAHENPEFDKPLLMQLSDQLEPARRAPMRRELQYFYELLYFAGAEGRTAVSFLPGGPLRLTKSSCIEYLEQLVSLGHVVRVKNRYSLARFHKVL